MLIMTNAELAEALKLHAFDDCDEQEIPTHLCNIAAERVIELDAEILRLRAIIANEATVADDRIEDDSAMDTSSHGIVQQRIAIQDAHKRASGQDA